MSRVKTIVLAILLFGGGYLAWQYELRNPKVAQEDKDEALLPGVEAEQVLKFSFVTTGGTQAVKREAPGGVWKTRAEARVNLDTVNQSLKMLLRLRVRNSIAWAESDEDQAIYGLAPPELVARLSGGFGERVVSFGKEHSISKRRYLQLENDGRIFLVDGPVFDVLFAASSALRSKRPWVFAKDKVQSISFVGGDLNILTMLERISGDSSAQQGEGSWQVRYSGQTHLADARLIEANIERLRRSEADGLVDDVSYELPVYGLNLPRLILTVNLQEPNDYGEREIIARFGQGIGLQLTTGQEAKLFEAAEAHYVKLPNDPTIYRFDSRFYRDFLQTPEHFFHKQPFLKLAQADVASWSFKLPSAAAITGESAKTQQFVKVLSSIVVLSYQRPSGSPQQYGWLEPYLTLSWTNKQENYSLKIGAEVAESSSSKGGTNDAAKDAPRFALINRGAAGVVMAIIGHEEVMRIIAELAQLK